MQSCFMFPHKSRLLLSTYLAFNRGPHSYWNVVLYHRATFLNPVVGLLSMVWDSFFNWEETPRMKQEDVLGFFRKFLTARLQWGLGRRQMADNQGEKLSVIYQCCNKLCCKQWEGPGEKCTIEAVITGHVRKTPLFCKNFQISCGKFLFLV